MLIHLISDLTRDTELQQRFKQRPLEVLAEYDIPEETQEIAWSEDRKKVEKILAREIAQLLDAMGSPGQPDYPNTILSLDSIDPVSAKTGKKTEVTVHGEYIGPGAKLTFQRHGFPEPPIKATKVEVDDAYTDDSVLTAKVKIEQPGTYDVKVTNPDYEEASLENAFTVGPPS